MIRCFAFLTLSSRLPEILVKVLDYFHRSHGQYLREKHPSLDCDGKSKAEEEAKTILGGFSKLRYEMMTDKPLTLLKDSGEDIPAWNQVHKEWLAKLQKEPTFFSVSWLYAECFMYRKVHEIFQTSHYFTRFDPFLEQKRNALVQSMGATITLG